MAVLLSQLQKEDAQEDPNNATELRRLYFSCIDSVCVEMKDRFVERNRKLMGALKPFLDASLIKPLLPLTNSPVVDTE